MSPEKVPYPDLFNQLIKRLKKLSCFAKCFNVFEGQKSFHAYFKKWLAKILLKLINVTTVSHCSVL